MTSSYDEDALRHWLADYLVTNVGCSLYDIDFDAPMSDLGLGSRDAVVLSGELTELLGRKISPVEFWQHPTISDLARFLTGAESFAHEDELEPDRGHLDEPIAVIGLGCRFPGDVSGPDEFWQFMCDGKNAITEVPPERWAPFDDGTPEVAATLAHTTRYGGYMDNLDEFDAEFFDISTREAAKMDPQQRMLLEVAWEALEHAGIPPSTLRRSQTGVFAGACYTDYGYVAGMDLTNVDAWSNSGGALSIIANRLSYFLDLRGPSVTVDTACSSSIVALHLASQSLRVGDSDVALAAGVNLMLAPAVVRAFDQTGALSSTGACHAFDADADGFIRGEGCGVVVLKRLSDAVRDGDRVLAVVRGSAVNQDGRSNGLLAPNPAAQMAVLRSAYANAGVPPQEVDYVEAHGTGTPLGDPIEARALGTVLGRGRAEDAPLLIGTVKTNIGHLEAAAGMAGLIKAVLAVQKGRIPQNLHFHTPNAHIPFDQLRLKVVAEQQEWPQTDHPRRAGVSSFGFGGTNAHAVIEQAPAAVPVIREADPAVSTLVLSGKSPERIASQARSLAEWLQGAGADVRLPDVAHTLNYHRERHPQFATVCVRDRAQAVAQLQALADGRYTDGADGIVGPHDGPCSPGTVFVYSGQGSHWAGMGRQLLEDEPVFAEAIAELDPIFVEKVGFSLQQDHRQRRVDQRRCAGSAGADGIAAGADRVVALLRSAPGCGDRPFDGRGHRGGGRRCAQRRRRAAGDRHPFAVDVQARRPRRGRTAEARPRGNRGTDRRLPRSQCGGLHFAARDGDRRRRGRRRRGDCRGERAEPFRSSGQHGGRVPHRVHGSDLGRIAHGARGFDSRDPHHPVLFDSRRGRRVADAGCRLLGGQRAPAGAAQPGRRGCRRGARDLHRDQCPSDPDPRRRRHAGSHQPSPQRGDVVARRRRRGPLPHQPQHRPHQSSAADPAPRRAAPVAADHAVAPRPPLGQPPTDHAGQTCCRRW